MLIMLRNSFLKKEIRINRFKEIQVHTNYNNWVIINLDTNLLQQLYIDTVLCNNY